MSQVLYIFADILIITDPNTTMKKFLYTFLMLFVGIATVCPAQQEASTVTPWDGKSKRLRMKPDSLITFSYTAKENGTLYIYADDQDVYDNVPVSIWGGWYHDGAYDPDSPLQEAGFYENGVGVYGWIKVFAGDEIRFTLSTPKDAAGAMAIFSIKSLLFNESVKGDSWERPIELTKGTKTNLPVYRSYDSDYLPELSFATFCRFVAPSDGVVTILTKEYLVHYIEEEHYGSPDVPMKYASQSLTTDDHEFVVQKDKAYIVIVPNSRPTSVTFKMNSTRLGENCKAPIELTELPATLDLRRGNNFYRLDLSTIGDKQMMELAVAANWKGTITYFNNCDYESEELLPADITGAAVSYTHNLDPMYMGNELLINFNVSNVSTAEDAVTLTLREPQEGESFDKATPVKVGENIFSGAARDYWFVYTATKDVEISVTSTGTIKHMLYSRGGGNIINEYNVYRINEGQSIYICITAAEGDNSLSISEKELVRGDYCDLPIEFSLGEDVIIKDRGDNVMNYRRFVAGKSGFAIFETTSENVIEYYWSIYFRQECGGKTLSYVREDGKDGSGKAVRSYKIPVTGGHSYIFEIMSFANDGADVIFTSRFEEAKEGDVCATAVELQSIGDTIALDNTPESTMWYKYVADKSGFYTVYAKIGLGSNLRVKVGDCDSDEINGSDDNRYSNAYMAGYKVCKVYAEQGQTLFIGTTINSDPGNTDGTNYYIVPTFAEARPGERFADAIVATTDIPYTLTTGAEGYEMWYVYTLPAGKETLITISSTTVKCYSSLLFYTDEKTSLSAYKKDYTQTNLTTDEGVIIGKSYLFPVPEAERTIYIKAPVATIAEPVMWSIGEKKEDPNPGQGVGEALAPRKEAVIYDLTGRRVTKPGRGIYIIDGKKVVIK